MYTAYKYLIIQLLLLTTYGVVQSQTTDFYINIETKLGQEVDIVSVSKTGKYFILASGNQFEVYLSETKELIKSIDTKNPQVLSAINFTNNDSVIILSFQYQFYYQKKFSLYNKPDKEVYLFNWVTEKKVTDTFYNSTVLYSKKKNSNLIFLVINEFFKYKSPTYADSTKAPLAANVLSKHANNELNNHRIFKYDEIVTQALSKDNKYLAIAMHAYILIVDPISFKTLDSISVTSDTYPALDLKFSPDGNYLAFHYSGHHTKAYIYSLDDRKLIYIFDIEKNTNAIKAIDINDSLFAISTGNLIRIVNYKTNEIVFNENPYTFHNSAITYVNDLEFYNNSNLLTLGGYNSVVDNNVMVHVSSAIVFDYEKYNELINETDSNKGVVSKKIKEQTFVVTQQWHKESLDFPVLKSENHFITVSNNDIFIWDKTSIRRINNFHFSDEIKQINYTNNGNYIVVKTGLGEDLRIIDPRLNIQVTLSKTDSNRFKFSGSQDFMSLYNDDILFTYSNYDECFIYNITDSSFLDSYEIGFKIERLAPKAIQVVDVICNVLITEDNKLIFHDPYKNEIIFSADFKTAPSYFNVINNQIIVGMMDGSILQFDYNEMEFIEIYKNPGYYYVTIEFLPDDRLFLYYKNEDNMAVQSIISLDNSKETILNSEQYINNAGLIDSKTYYVDDIDNLRFIDLNSNSEYMQLSRLKGEYGDVKYESISKRQNLLSVEYSIVDLEKAEISHVDSRLSFYKDKLFIKEITLNAFENNARIGIASFNQKDDTINVATVKEKWDFGMMENKVANNNNYAISLGGYDYFYVWDLNKFELLKQITCNKTSSFNWDDTGNRFLFLDNDNKTFDYLIRIFDLEKIKFIKIESPKLSILDQVCFSPNDSIILAGYKSVNRFNIYTNEYDDDYFYHPDYVSKMIYNLENDMLFVGLENGEIFVWSYSDNKLLYRLWKHTDAILDLIIDGNTLISSSDDQSLKIWDIEKGILTASYYQYYIEDNIRYCFITEDNYYKSSKNVSDFIHFVDNGKAYPIEQFDLKYNRPDILLDRLGYASQELIDAYHKAYLKRLKKMDFKEEDLSSEFHIPESAIENFEYLPIIEEDELELKMNFKDSKYNLDRYNIWINDVPILGVRGKSLKNLQIDSISISETIQLSKGNNKIQISCLNVKGAESYKETVEITYNPKQPTKPNLYLVALSVSNYQQSEMNLKYAVKDGRDITNLYAQNTNNTYDNIYIDTLFNSDATLENVLSIKQKLLKSNVDDQIILYVSGHGLLDNNLDFYFASHDMDFSNPALRGISYEILEGLLDSIPARKKLFMMDACHSGEVDKEDLTEDSDSTQLLADGTRKNGVKTYSYKGARVLTSENNTNKLGLQNSFELMQELFTNLNRGSGAMVISAAGGDSYALESNEWNNGVFTYAVINGLKNKAADKDNDGEITVSELRSYVIEQVQELTNGRQKPTSRQENVEFDFRVW